MPPGRGSRLHSILAAVLILATLSAGLGRGLFEPSEGRYGSIAVEMARSNDYLVPRLNGVEHYEKPPLASWAMALSIEWFGESEAALRLPGVLAAAGVLASVYLLAGGRSSSSAPWAVLLTLASPLFFAMARVVTTDVYLAACSALALLGSAHSLDPARTARARSLWLTLAAFGSALGFLVKGPVILILVLGPALLEALWSRDPGQVRAIFAPRRLVLFLALALPWFVVVCARTPGLTEWFLGHRSVSVLSDADGFHTGSPLYYFPVLLLGALPATWILLGLGSGWREILCSRRERLCCCALLFPLAVFSLSASKLAPYALPLVAPASVLAKGAVARGLGRRGIIAVAVFQGSATLCGLGIGLTNGWFSGLPGSAGVLFTAAAITSFTGAAVALVLALKHGPRPSCAASVASTLIALLLCVPAVDRAEPEIVRSGSGREISRRLSELAADGRPILGYRCFVRSLPFYSGRRMLLADFYETDVTYARHLAEVDVHGPEQLRALLTRGPVVLLCRTKQSEQLQREAGPLQRVAEIGRYSIFSGPTLEADASSFVEPGNAPVRRP